MEIYEPQNNDKNETVTVTVNVPVRFYLHGTRSDQEYKKIAVETLRNHASAIFEHTALAGFFSEEHDWDFHVLHPLLDMLGTFGQGLMEAIEQVEMDFESKRFNYHPARQSDAKTDNVTTLKAAA